MCFGRFRTGKTTPDALVICATGWNIDRKIVGGRNRRKSALVAETCINERITLISTLDFNFLLSQFLLF
jgi:hypothetical protein